jgi:hypothetical protein
MNVAEVAFILNDRVLQRGRPYCDRLQSIADLSLPVLILHVCTAPNLMAGVRS